MTEQDDDVFNDAKETVQVGAIPAKEPEQEHKGVTPDPEKEQPAETPAAVEGKSEKLIPEHRMKAALRSASEKIDALRDENRRLKGEEPDADLSEVLLNQRINMSREIMIETKPDYEEMENVFAELAKEDESLISKMRNAQNPAKFAYKMAKEHLEVQDLRKTKESDDWKSFQKWKEEQAKKPQDNVESIQEKRKKAALSVPDLTKATAVKPKDDDEDEDNVFRGSKF